MTIHEKFPYYECLANSSKPVFEFIKQWLAEYPADHKDEMEARLKSTDTGMFKATYFELQIFAMLNLNGCEVEIHPSFANTEGKVDFCVTHKQERFYLEAATCLSEHKDLEINLNELDAVRKIKQAITNPHSNISLHTNGSLEKTLSASYLVDKVRSILDSCTPEEVKDSYNNKFISEFPYGTITDNGWVMEIYLSPTEKPSGSIHGPFRSAQIDDSLSLRKSLMKKVESWKKKKITDETFLIAINASHADYLPGSELQVIYGHDNPDLGKEEFSEYLSRVSGIIFFGRATVGNEHSATVTLYRNGNRQIPDCLSFLQNNSRLSELLKIQY